MESTLLIPENQFRRWPGFDPCLCPGKYVWFSAICKVYLKQAVIRLDWAASTSSLRIFFLVFLEFLFFFFFSFNVVERIYQKIYQLALTHMIDLSLPSGRRRLLQISTYYDTLHPHQSFIKQLSIIMIIGDPLKSLLQPAKSLITTMTTLPRKCLWWKTSHSYNLENHFLQWQHFAKRRSSIFTLSSYN